MPHAAQPVVHVVQPFGLLLRDDVQPVEVHRLAVADHHGQRRRQVQDVLRGVSSDGLAGSHPVAIVGELAGERSFRDLREPVGVVSDSMHANCQHPRSEAGVCSDVECGAWHR